VAIVRSDDSVLDDLSDPSSFENVDYNDPRAVADWARRMGEASGADLGDDYEELIDQMAQGADLDEPGLGGDAGFGPDDLDF
jgi:hypothetical protein